MRIDGGSYIEGTERVNHFPARGGHFHGTIPFFHRGIMIYFPPMATKPRMSKEREVLLKLHEINRRMESEADSDRLIRFILDQAISLSRAERGFLVFRKSDGTGYDIPVARNIGKEMIDEPVFEVSRGIIEDAWKSGLPVVLDNARMDRQFGPRDSVSILKLASVACLPLRKRGRTYGVLYLDNRLRRGLFLPEDMLIMELFADYASMSVLHLDSRRDQDTGLKEMEEENERLRRGNQELKGTLLVLSDRLKEYEKGIGGEPA